MYKIKELLFFFHFEFPLIFNFNFKLLNIPKLGHRKRLLSSLGILKQKIARHSVRSMTEMYINNDAFNEEKNNRSPASKDRLKTVTFADSLENTKNNTQIYENDNLKNELKIIEDKTVKKLPNYSKYLKDYKSANQLCKHNSEMLQIKGFNYNVQVNLRASKVTI